MANNILLVDDDKEIREWLELDLKFSGYNVTTAQDGAEGLQKALNENYNLIILDVMMPKIDGFTVCQHIRKIKKDIKELVKQMPFVYGCDEELPF